MHPQATQKSVRFCMLSAAPHMFLGQGHQHVEQ